MFVSVKTVFTYFPIEYLPLLVIESTGFMLMTWFIALNGYIFSYVSIFCCLVIAYEIRRCKQLFIENIQIVTRTKHTSINLIVNKIRFAIRIKQTHTYLYKLIQIIQITNKEFVSTAMFTLIIINVPINVIWIVYLFLYEISKINFLTLVISIIIQNVALCIGTMPCISFAEEIVSTRKYCNQIQQLLCSTFVAYKIKLLNLYELINNDKKCVAFTVGPTSPITRKTVFEVIGELNFQF